MPLLELNRVSKRFGGLLAVNQVSFSINEGVVAFIVGPNGAGKTTLFNLIAGVFHPDEGNIHFRSKEISQLSPNRAVHLGIGRTFQIVRPLPNLSVLENTMLGAFLHTRSPAKAAEEAEKVLRILQMGNALHLPASGLSLPMLKRLEIARALATRPKLILLDEVVAGLSTSEALALAERSEEHTSELQSRQYLVCRLLLEKKKKRQNNGQSSEVDAEVVKDLA